jgi:hypothetical protein
MGLSVLGKVSMGELWRLCLNPETIGLVAAVAWSLIGGDRREQIRARTKTTNASIRPSASILAPLRGTAEWWGGRRRRRTADVARAQGSFVAPQNQDLY